MHELAGHHIDPDTGRFLSSRGVGQHQYASLAHNPAVGAVATEGSVDNPYNPFSRWGGRVLSWVEEHHEDFRAEYMDGKTLEDVCGGMGDPGQQLSCISNARNVQVGSAALGAIVSTAQGANSLAATGLDLELSHLPGDIGRQARRALISDYRSAVAGMDFLFNGNAHTGSRTGFGYLWDQQLAQASAAWEGDLGAQTRLAQTEFEVGGEIVLAFATGGSSAAAGVGRALAPAARRLAAGVGTVARRSGATQQLARMSAALARVRNDVGAYGGGFASGVREATRGRKLPQLGAGSVGMGSHLGAAVDDVIRAGHTRGMATVRAAREGYTPVSHQL